ncbi:hypothetical protein Cycma_3863 [Cyclobacterium marinum DSM 745]|uniref:Uncharacterized protein n=1 Tax=Cyclobacterium marinum (strain ATCC 25205 / DSM 745 / LMG 13164 / NCIMB 1802) TaxID=880070 RepID=G0J5D7_CYCMS|nr:hypothetical protein Cycma_3863 [Cyclobacterium marinum DSM 745]
MAQESINLTHSHIISFKNKNKNTTISIPFLKIEVGNRSAIWC